MAGQCTKKFYRDNILSKTNENFISESVYFDRKS